jgi:hypothetical protein
VALWVFHGFGYGEVMTASDESEIQDLPARQPSEAERRKARAALKLRENLARRKQQARARRAGEEDVTEGLPASGAHKTED